MTIHPRLLHKLDTLYSQSAESPQSKRSAELSLNSQSAEPNEPGRSETIPVILYYCRPREEVRQCILRRYGPIKYELPFINAMALDLPPEKVRLMAKERMVQWITEDVAVSKIGEGGTPGGILHPPEAPSSSSSCGNPRRPPARRVPLSDRPASEAERPRWAPAGRRPGQPNSLGRAVSVAVIDTGVAFHPDLVHPVNRIRAFCDLIDHQTEPYDDDGHGTHIAGIVAGLASWPGQGKSGGGRSVDRQVGEVYAPDYPMGGVSAAAVAQGRSWSPDIVAIKALDGEGNGTASDILAAMQWTVNNRRHFNIRVVNLSLGVSADHEDDSDPLVRGVEALTRLGLCVVCAAGNSGPKPRTISSPGICPYAVTVGAAEYTGEQTAESVSHSRFRVASFSGRGPTPQGLQKPDLVAPGVDILSLNAKVDSVSEANDPPGYIHQSGTSMAAPFVSREAAGICQAYPFAGPLLIKEILLNRTEPLTNELPEAQGRGVLL